jgi:CheY-like chemotaxis protein
MAAPTYQKGDFAKFTPRGVRVVVVDIENDLLPSLHRRCRVRDIDPNSSGRGRSFWGDERDLEPLNILVVDDEEPIRQVMSHVINVGFYNCLTASDGVDAMTLLAASNYDVVITDIAMPNMDGNQLLKNIRDNYPTVYVLGMSGFGSATPPEGYSFDYFIAKPITPQSLEIAVREAMGLTW